MDHFARRPIVAFLIILCAVAQAFAQQAPYVQQQAAQPVQQAPGVQSVAPQPPAALQVPEEFRLNALEQAALDATLGAWQLKNKTIKTFQCKFERREYDPVFGPSPQVPLYMNTGELNYNQPDKGSFQITQTKKWQAAPAAPDQPAGEVRGGWIEQPNAIGDHWVCDGKSVYQYRPDLKQLVEYPIPPQLQGQAIVDGPLPFLFGADPIKLKERYWLRLDQRNTDPNRIWIIAKPKNMAQAADFTEIDIDLEAKQLLPLNMQVVMPNGSRHVYIFDTANASINNPLARIQAIFSRPSVPFGWKHVVESVPMQQAAQPQPPAR